ncbi:GAF domain-containing protein [Solemya pervernicosa gill symbiont]|uniref:GAF domain-containing protein n=1 Tax=Solemya pervernicosa gill symbiont TaxID=642797 RepID=UPI0022A9B2AA|nr:GAF domain-containing protein [Solemya pervernicosa gill symbiont]
MEMVLEGISRGVGMDRVLFAMLTPDRKLLKARYTVGWDAIKLKQEFSFDVLPESANVFRYLLETGEAIYVDSHSPYNIRIMVTESVKEIVDDAPFFAMPIKVAGRTIGIFYADRKPSKRELNEELYSSFKHFCQQAMLGIAHISARH